MHVMAAIYQQLLENEGYSVETKLVTTRDVYLPELSNGNVDIVPDYLAGITDFLNTEKNGPDAAQVSSNDARRDPRRAGAARRGAGHLDPAALRRHRPERLLRVPGVRRRQRPRDLVRPGRARQAHQARRAAGLRGSCRLRGRADRGLRLRRSPRSCRSTSAARRSRTPSPTARSTSARPAPPTAPSPTSVWCCSRTTRASSRPEPHARGQRRLPGRQPRPRGPLQLAVRGADHRGPRRHEPQGRPRAPEARGRRCAVPRGQGSALTGAAPADAGRADDPALRRRQDLRRRHRRRTRARPRRGAGRAGGPGRARRAAASPRR